MRLGSRRCPTELHVKRFILAAVILATSAVQAQRTVSFDSLSERQTISGFRTEAVYLNDSGSAMGARFAHVRSGFTLDLLQIQSVPQAFVWVTTFPTSNMGEPHTQEHLLLGKGNKGRAVSNQEFMSLSVSTAFTMQWRTCYTFYTSAGGDVFHDEFERRIDALLHPDYTDEEIRREVRNFGVTESEGLPGGAKRLGLEEKGTVYNEMVSSMDQPGSRLYRAAGAMTYGSEHPLAYISGGSPEALRAMQPADIRRFHLAHYHLANMGAVVSVPKEMSIDRVLARLDATLNKVQPRRPNQAVRTEKDLPAPRPAPAGQIQFVEYPHRNDQQPGLVALMWPADRNLDVTEQTFLELFLEAFAGDPTTNLYKRLIDSRTRESDLGAQSVVSYMEEDQGFPVTIRFADVPVARMNEVEDGIYFVIGPERQFSAWEEYLKSVEGPATKVYRLYPRDFWQQ
jgi:Zn-dependent M16 (insulinase) family peptidase